MVSALRFPNNLQSNRFPFIAVLFVWLSFDLAITTGSH